MEIAATTKISALIKANPAAIEAIASISPHFNKLRNPLLRKILASRVTIADAARIGGCQVEAFFEKLAPLGFAVKPEGRAPEKPENEPMATLPLFLEKLPPAAIVPLDVREDIATGNDPFHLIMDAVEKVNGQNALVIINTFEPTPLIHILQKKGFDSFTQVHGPELVHTYFWRKGEPSTPVSAIREESQDVDGLLAQYAGKVKHIDVRQMEMPQPMVTILHELEWLPTGSALHVTHQRVPQFLLPQLESRGFKVAIKEAGPAEVYLFIYKP